MAAEGANFCAECDGQCLSSFAFLCLLYRGQAINASDTILLHVSGLGSSNAACVQYAALFRPSCVATRVARTSRGVLRPRSDDMRVIAAGDQRFMLVCCALACGWRLEMLIAICDKKTRSTPVCCARGCCEVGM